MPPYSEPGWKKIGLAVSLGAGLLTGAVSAPAAALSPVDRLVAEDEIRQQIALYGYLADGDGKNPPDIRALADRILTPDSVTDVMKAAGHSRLHLEGRKAVVDSTPPPAPDSPLVNRHNYISTYFDEITADSAKTRTTVVWFLLARQKQGVPCMGENCTSQLRQVMTFVYHDIWRKTAEGWQKARSVIYPAS